MGIINIDEQIENWKSNSAGPNDYWIEISNYLSEFKRLTNLEKYISDDSENYYEGDSYKDLLQDISEIVKPGLIISDIEVNDWIFTFKVNGKIEKIEMEDPDTDWLQDTFIVDLNSIIANHGSENKLRMVFASSENNADQCFDLCFINDKTHKLLSGNSPKYGMDNEL